MNISRTYRMGLGLGGIGSGDPRLLLNQPSVKDAAQQALRYLSNIGDRIENVGQIHELLYELICRIFGVNNRPSWLAEAQHQKDVYSAVMNLLIPEGHLFRVMMMSLREDPFYYEFPVTNLPPDTQQKIQVAAYHMLPAPYRNKIKFLLENPRPAVLPLNAFEFFTFCFSNYIVSPPPAAITAQKMMPRAQPKKNLTPGKILTYVESFSAPLIHPHHEYNIYMDLLRRYLNYFFPIGPIQAPSKAANPAPGVGAAMATANSLYPARGSISVMSEIFLEILVEFWLNQFTIATPPGASSSTSGSINASAIFQYASFPPVFVKNSQQVLKAATELVKHILSDPALIQNMQNVQQQAAISANQTVNQSMLNMSSVSSGVLSVMAGSVFTMPFKTLQKPLYAFLRAAFCSWPRSATQLEPLVSLWLTYIQPWNFTPATSSAEKPSLAAQSRLWTPYILLNYAFYSTILIDFLRLLLASELLLSPREVSVIMKVLEIFSQLRELLWNADDFLATEVFNPGAPRRTAGSSKHSLARYAGAMREHILFIEDSSSSASGAAAPISMMQPSTTIAANMPPLVGGAGMMPQPRAGYTPIFSGKTREIASNLIVVAKAIVVDPADFGLAPTEAKRFERFKIFEKGGNKTAANIKNLESIVTLLAQIFKVNVNELNERVMLAVKKVHKTPHTEIRPAELADTRLSPRGKEQIIRGQRICSNMDVKYIGDELHRPIGTNEIAFLARLLIRLADYLNERFATPAESRYYSMTPMPGSDDSGFLSTSAVMRDRQQRRFDWLRYMASYQALGLLALCVLGTLCLWWILRFFLWLFSSIRFEFQ